MMNMSSLFVLQQQGHPLQRLVVVCVAVVLCATIVGCTSTSAPLLSESIATMEANPVTATFQLPSEVRNVVNHLPREALVGKWAGTMTRQRAKYQGAHKSKTFTNYGSLTYDFKEDGTYKAIDLEKTKYGTWEYADGFLTLNETLDCCHKTSSANHLRLCETYANLQKSYRIDWYSDDEIRICWRTKESGSEFYTRAHEWYGKLFPALNPRSRVTIDFDKNGCTIRRVYNEWGNGNGEVIMIVSSPEEYRRVTPRQSAWNANSAAEPKDQKKAIGKAVAYEILKCERDGSRDFSYRFVLELKKEENRSLETFGWIQQEFRAAIKRDYANSFPGVNENSLYVEFPEYKLENGIIQGRAVVLTISVTSLSYDPNTRRGKLAVKVNANQYEEARKWIRKNIETLARDKNIALTTGEIPPAAKFYLGREELKDGNVLEIEFKTE